MPLPVCVLGVGNVLHQDDAVGPYVVAALQAQYDMPPGVAVVDIGTPGFDLIPFVSDVSHLIVVDTVNAAGTPGEVRLYDRDQILAGGPERRLGPHDPSLKAALLTAAFAGQAPAEVLLIGVVPASTRPEIGLTEPVRAAVPGVLARLVDALTMRGYSPTPRSFPAPPDFWWEREADAGSRR